jgi:hypothetical protein
VLTWWSSASPHRFHGDSSNSRAEFEGVDLDLDSNLGGDLDSGQASCTY